MEIKYIYSTSDGYYSITVDKKTVETLMELVVANAKLELELGETENASESLKMWAKMNREIAEEDEQL